MNRGSAFAALSGALFAVGLAVSGMTRPEKVVGFLDFTGAWDASLMFVMMGAIGVHLVARRLIVRRKTPLFGDTFHVPVQKTIDLRLVLGAGVFGVGWALGGFCPGPAFVTAAGRMLPAIVFVVGMTIGMKIEHAVDKSPT